MDEKVLEYVNSDIFLPSFIENTDSEVVAIAKQLRRIILKESAIKRLKCLKLIRSISEYNPAFLEYVGKHLIGKLHKLALFNKESQDPSKGNMLFSSKDSSNQEASASFLILLLDSIEFWSKISKVTNKESIFSLLYNDLCESGVCFLRYIPHENEIVEKLEEINGEILSVNCKICATANPVQVKEYLRNLRHFKSSIKALIKKSPDLEEKYINDIEIISGKVRKIYEQYKTLKNSNSTKRDSTDPIPKLPPRPDSPEFLETSEHNIEEYSREDDHETEWQDIVRII